jgi:outer membrane protein TolC
MTKAFSCGPSSTFDMGRMEMSLNSRLRVAFGILLLGGCDMFPVTPVTDTQPTALLVENAAGNTFTSPLQSEVNEQRKNEGAGVAENNSGAERKQRVTLPMAIELCVNNNFRVLAGAEKMRQADAELLTASLIPNTTLFADYQLIPLEAEVLWSIPVDWLLFGKRLAAMQAARLGIEVSSVDSANVLRVQLEQTVDAFYEVLMDDAYFKLAEKNLQELSELEEINVELAKGKKVGPLELDRVKLAVHEAVLERHDRELALELAKARLRPFLGRSAADADYEVDCGLTVTAVVPPPIVGGGSRPRRGASA